MDDDELIERFEDASLPLGSLHHEEHVRIAFLYLCRYTLLEVLRRFPSDLRRYASAHGKAGLYHETISWAYVFIIHERLAAAAEPTTWDEFRQRNRDLFDRQRPILTEYYCDDTLASATARARFVMPDRSLRSFSR